MQNAVDIFIIGGGINGTAIAADAAGRDLSVILCEKNDFASGTSSASTKLIHGGLRYLEQYEFNLVRKALQECDVLLRRASYIIRPLEFILPHEKHLRPAWMIRIGLFLYDHLSRRRFLPQSKYLNFEKKMYGNALRSEFKKGFSYYDCHTDDSRLVVLNALSAKENGATLHTNTQFISARRENNRWKIQLKNNRTNQEFFCYAKSLINAAGPWIKEIQKNIYGSMAKLNVELVKGSHIVVPKLYEGKFAYILQNEDKRIVFAIPYQNEFTLIGTTDIKIDSNLNHVAISDTEKKYLCDIINHYFEKNIQITDIVWSYAGVRCLQGQDDETPSEITRDYKLLLENENGNAPLLTVLGGKLTTHRTLAEEAIDKLKPFFPQAGKAWTAKTPLPGGDIEKYDFNAFCQKLKSDYPWLPEEITHRYAQNYGTRVYQLLNHAKNIADLGEHFAAGLYQKEVEFLMQQEWAVTWEDILWRRTKLGLFFTASDVKKLSDWLAAKN